MGYGRGHRTSIPTRIALVPYDAKVDLRELLHVAAGLQTQVTRDLTPVWGVSAVVSAFFALDDVPPGFLPLALITDELLLNREGFHFPWSGEAGAAVRYCGDWSLCASHELIELLCDPSGNVTWPAQSLADEKNEKGGRPVIDSEGPAYERQGHVEYLMEVCDPVEQSWYEIDGVYVSDFVTPSYYDSDAGAGTRYSFTGRVKRPLQLLRGGYITWSTGDAVFQAFAPPVADGVPSIVESQTLEILPLGAVPANFSRQWVDSHPQAKDLIRKRACKEPATYRDTHLSSRYGASLQTELESVLRFTEAPRTSSLTVVELLRRLVEDAGFRGRFEADPTSAIRQLNAEEKLAIPVPPDLTGPLTLPGVDQHKQLLEQLLPMLSRGHRFGFDYTGPDMVAALAKLAKFGE